MEDVCNCLASKGFTPGENAYVGTVHPVHTSSSLHYRTIRSGEVVEAFQSQGRLAIDVNDNDLDDDALPFDSEHEALLWLYRKLLTFFGPRGANVLDECLFNGLGFIKENPTTNHPIGGHDGHLHVGFKVLKW